MAEDHPKGASVASINAGHLRDPLQISWLCGKSNAFNASALLGIRLVSRTFSGFFTVMKTTLELPENLVRQAEVVAARNGLPLGVFVADAIEEKLGNDPGGSIKPWKKHFGSLRHLHEESARIDQCVAEEFRTVEPENWQ